jgi:multiple sugar transport system permease protein
LWLRRELAPAQPLWNPAMTEFPSLQRHQRRFILLMLTPAVVLLLGLTIFPFATSLILSLTNYSLLKPGEINFTGLQNYLDLLTEPEFWLAFRVTLVFTVVCVTVQTLLGLFIAVLLHQEAQAAPILRAIYLLPLAITPVAATFTFRMMFNPSLGVFNYFLRALGLPPSAWLADPNMALPSLVIVDMWQWTPFILLIVAGGLTVLPQEPFEAAKVDGANGWQTFRYLMLPMLMPYLGVAVLFRSIDAFKTFDIIYVLTGGGPGIITRTLNLYAYKNGVEYLSMGYASSVAIIMLILITVFARLFVRRTSLLRGSEG